MRLIGLPQNRFQCSSTDQRLPTSEVLANISCHTIAARFLCKQRHFLLQRLLSCLVLESENLIRQEAAAQEPQDLLSLFRSRIADNRELLDRSKVEIQRNQQLARRHRRGGHEPLRKTQRRRGLFEEFLP